MSFTARVYEIVKQIPPGKVATYQYVAALAGNPKVARAVGAAMRHNPDASSIPCHRVVAADGSMRGYAFGKGTSTKHALLAKEGVIVQNGRVDVVRCHWEGFVL